MADSDLAGSRAVCPLCRDEMVTIKSNVNSKPYWTCRNRQTTINLHDSESWGWVAQFVGKDVDDVPSGVGEPDPPLRVESEEEPEGTTEEESEDDSDWFQGGDSEEQDDPASEESVNDPTVESILTSEQ